MKIWVVYFRGEPEYATRDFYDAAERAEYLRRGYEGEIRIVREEVED